MFQMVTKLKRVKYELKALNTRHYQKLEERVKECLVQVQQIQGELLANPELSHLRVEQKTRSERIQKIEQKNDLNGSKKSNNFIIWTKN